MKIITNLCNIKSTLYLILVSLITISEVSHAQPLVKETKEILSKNQRGIDTIATKTLEDLTIGGDKTVILNNNNDGNDNLNTPINPNNDDESDNDDPTNEDAIDSDNNKNDSTPQRKVSKNLKKAKTAFKQNKEEIQSIMFTQEDMIKINEALNALQTGVPLQAEGVDPSPDGTEDQSKPLFIKEQSRMYLDAILYISKNNWIAWVNGGKIISEDNIKTNPIYISSIDSSKTKIKWTMGISKWRVLTGQQDVDESVYHINKNTGDIEVEFTLRTNQTYNLVSNKVTEGKN